ncbi:unnamed protein product, partial [Adineta ricciae]
MKKLYLLNIERKTPYELHMFEDEYPENVELKQIRSLNVGSLAYSNGSIYDLNKFSHSFPNIEHLSGWPIQSRSDMIYSIGQFKQLSSITFYVHWSLGDQFRCSEFRANLIVNDIEEFLHRSAICQIDFISVQSGIPERIHLWLGEE